MHYKKGDCWKAVYDEDRNLYTAGFFDPISGTSKLYEIDKEIYNQLKDDMDNSAVNILCAGRDLYAYINDQYGPAFIIVFDESYRELCPWASVPIPEPEKAWTKEMAAAVVDALEIEKNNHNQKNLEYNDEEITAMEENKKRIPNKLKKKLGNYRVRNGKGCWRRSLGDFYKRCL